MKLTVTTVLLNDMRHLDTRTEMMNGFVVVEPGKRPGTPQDRSAR